MPVRIQSEHGGAAVDDPTREPGLEQAFGLGPGDDVSPRVGTGQKHY
jgi:hypothetical protein